MPVLLQVRDLKSRSLDVDFHEVSWVLANTSEDVLDYTFQVLRSESPSGPFDSISTPFDDRYVFIDNVVQIAHRWRKYFYVLRVTQKRSNDFQDFIQHRNHSLPQLSNFPWDTQSSSINLRPLHTSSNTANYTAQSRRCHRVIFGKLSQGKTHL